MFHLVRSTTNAIGWIKASEHLGYTWFVEYELRHINNSMVDLGHERIFSVMLVYSGQFNFYPFLFVMTLC
jgi:hypothetical protein